MFDEYVYLSDSKVAQFIPRDVRWWSRMRAKKAGAKAKIGGVEAWLELETADLARTAGHLPKLEKYISEFGLWYEEPGLTPGDWVFFDGRIGYQVMDQDPAQGAVLFCQAGGRAGPSRRIVLHGSAAHLVRSAPTPERMISDTPPYDGFSAPWGFASVLEAAGNTVVLPGSERAFWQFFDKSPAAKGAFSKDALPQHLETLFESIACTEWYLGSAPYLGGCAKVTSVIDLPTLPFEVVVASPLFVRHQRP